MNNNKRLNAAINSMKDALSDHIVEKDDVWIRIRGYGRNPTITIASEVWGDDEINKTIHSLVTDYLASIYDDELPEANNWMSGLAECFEQEAQRIRRKMANHAES